ncbi:hypothetical protein HF086_001993 [Spodoptera exigua]|uniref:Retrotransposon gag domain-containing protein n=1 Tax=Spodoptera exigua TaxID=7107 RepID=A0A922ML79_SPOEX|nr:hypothetical protein HF086_001993 [Spodoptera exigua]
MEKFNLKTAASLVPVMDSTEESVEKIIDSVELYDCCLTETSCKKITCFFCIKTRLTKTAKLKLKRDYDSCTDLIKDMKLFLLTKKSSNSLMTQLNSIRQNDLSIADFGSKLEELFTDLTISQAKSNNEAFEILRPINEELAVKKFADGLRNRRLSTIIAARNYTDLKDAVRAALDEELSQPQPTTSNSILNIRGKSHTLQLRGRGNYHFRSQSGFRGNFSQNRGNNNSYANRNRTFQYNNFAFRGRQSRGFSHATKSRSSCLQ